MARRARTERLNAFSDGVFAVLITILVLDLHPPHEASWSALAGVWPTGISYAASYAFIAIVWANHHHLMGFTELSSGKLMWGNFAHLFSVSLVPFTTEWMASTHLASVAVCAYAVVFVLVNATYVLLCMEAIDRSDHPDAHPELRRRMRVRSFITLGIFVLAAVTALWDPRVGFGLVVACLAVYVRPAVE